MKRAGDVISALFDEGLVKQAKTYSAFFSCWKDLMEKNGIPAAADHSRIKNLERGLVWVEVDHPGWKQILQTKESKLLADFRYRFPQMDISGLSILLCKPGTRPEPPAIDPVAEPAPAKKSPPETVPVSLGLGYDGIKDESLKEVLKRLERNIAGRNKKK